MSIELKACPFCGSEAKLGYSGYKKECTPFCTNDDCPMSESWNYTDEISAANAWNIRLAEVTHQPDECRDGFEAWYLKEYPAASFTRHQLFPDLYLWEHAQVCWNAWQGRGSAPERESIGFVEALANAEKVVKAYPLYRKFIDGTPLQNDIAVWMAEFAVKGGKP